VIVVVIVAVVGPLIVAVHVNGNATVRVIESVPVNAHVTCTSP